MKQRKVAFVALLIIFALVMVGMVAAGGQKETKAAAAGRSVKFREVPKEWIMELWQKLDTPMTPGGPKGEKRTDIDKLELTAAEKARISEMDLKDYTYMAATIDIVDDLVMYGMNETLKEFGKKEIGFMGSKSISDQIDQALAMLPKAEKTSFLIIQAYEAETTGSAFTQLSIAGIPQVHNWTTPKGVYESPSYVGLVDADGYGQGAAAAEILSYMMNYKGEVGLVYFAFEQWTNVMRLKGAEETFAKYPEIKVVGRAGFNDPAEGKDVATGLLQQHPEIDAIWCTWMMGPGTGAAEAVTALGRVGEVIVAAPDLAGTTGARFIADPNSPIVGAGEADVTQMGRINVLAAFQWLLGNKAKLKDLYTVSRVYPIVRANLLEGWKESKNEMALGPLPDEVLQLLKQ